jgi:LPXTG-motif cell wall-anchored protein
MAARRMSMPLRLAIAAAVGAAGVAAAASTAAAAATDPAGNNGTVKIDGVPFDNWPPNNEPHVTCEFEIQFFGFDEGQTADITLKGHPPSSPDRVVTKTWDDFPISDDAHGGAANDPDARIHVSATELANLAGMKPNENQGFHIRLDVVSPEGPKHKVFWLEPCVAPTSPPASPPTSPPTSPPSSPPTSPGAVTTSPGGGQLPVTGTALGGLVALGLGLIGGGAALVVMRRRRDQVTFTS